MAPHEIKSAIYCGEMTSKNSLPAGIPVFGGDVGSVAHIRILS